MYKRQFSVLRVIVLRGRARKNIAGKMFRRELSHVVEYIWEKKQQIMWRLKRNTSICTQYTRGYQIVRRLSL